MHAILWCSESCDYNKDEYDMMKYLLLVLEPLHWEHGTKSPAVQRSTFCCSRSLLQSCAAFSSALEVFHWSVLRSEELKNLSILLVKFCCLLNVPSYQQVLSEASENALLESESTLLIFRGVWEHLEVHGPTCEVAQSGWEYSVLLPDWFSCCWCFPGPLDPVPNPPWAAQRFQLLWKSPADLGRCYSSSNIRLLYQLYLVASRMHLHNSRCFRVYMRLLIKSLGALYITPQNLVSIWKYLGVLLRLTAMFGRIA